MKNVIWRLCCEQNATYLSEMSAGNGSFILATLELAWLLSWSPLNRRIDIFNVCFPS